MDHKAYLEDYASRLEAWLDEPPRAATEKDIQKVRTELEQIKEYLSGVPRLRIA